MTPSPNAPDPGLAAPAPPRPGPGPVAASVEASTALVLRYFEMWNTGQGTVADELMAPTYIEHAHPDFLGPAASRSLVPRVHALYPGMVVSAEVVVADAELVVVRTRLEPGDVDGHPEGPRRGMAMFRVADGKLAEQWSWYAPVGRIAGHPAVGAARRA
jgi:hypothetical protein